MGFTRMAFTPSTGLKNADVFPATPTTEDAAREQVQGVIDQLRDYINNTLLPTLASVITGNSGADNIGSAAISGVESATGVSALTVYDQLVAIKAIADAAVSGALIPGCIDDANMFAAGVVALAAMAANSVDSDQYVDYSIDPEHLASDAVTQRAIADKAVGTDQIANGAVTGLKIGAQTVEEGNIAANAVTKTKIAADAVETDRIKNLNVTADKLAANAVTTAKILNGNVTGEKIANGTVTAANIAVLEYLKMGDSKPIKFNGDNDYIYYNSSTKQLMLKLNGCTAVQLAPVTFGTLADPTPGTYPAGTLYIRHE